MKLLVETNGPFLKVDYTQGGLVIQSHRPTVVAQSEFVSTNVANGQLTVLGTVTDDATDDAFLEAMAGSKTIETAVAAFLAEFNPKPTPATEKKAVK